jgi:hypothetical protein
MLKSDVSMTTKSNTLRIHGIYESMTNVHEHNQYTVDLCDIYEVTNMTTGNTQWIHVKVDHNHK